MAVQQALRLDRMVQLLVNDQVPESLEFIQQDCNIRFEAWVVVLVL